MRYRADNEQHVMQASPYIVPVHSIKSQSFARFFNKWSNSPGKKLSIALSSKDDYNQHYVYLI